MMRTESQIFFNHLPGQLQRDTKFKIISVVPAEPGQVTSMDEKTAYDEKIMDEACKVLVSRQVIHNEDEFRADNYALRRVTGVQQRLFPATFTCNSCGRVLSQTPARFKSNPDKAFWLTACPVCKNEGRQFKDMRQESLVITHECGLLDQPHLRPCKTSACQQEGRGHRHLTIRKGKSQQVRELSWWCLKCETKTGDLFVPHIDHGSCDYNQRQDGDGSVPSPAIARPYQDPAVFRRVGFTLVNHSMDSLKGIRRDSALAKVLYEIHLGKREAADLKEVSSAGLGKDRRAIEGALDFLGHSISDLPRIVAEKGDVYHQLVDYGKRKGFDVDALAQGDDQDLSPLGLNQFLAENEAARDALLDYYQLMDPYYGAIHWLDWVQQANDIPTYDTAGIERATDTMTGLGLEDVLYTPRLPIAHVALGYERGRFNYKKSFKFFPVISAEDRRFPFYVHNLETEAILFKLDAKRIVDWLRARGYEVDEAQDEVSGRRILLNHLDHHQLIEAGFSDIVDPLSRDVYTLLHTFSHCLLKMVNAHSSDDSSNMGELLMPGVPAVVLFLNKRSRFTSGGIQYLYQRNLGAWLQDAAEQARLCMNDPTCRFSKDHATCYGCTQGSEIGCARFNKFLDRATLWDFSRSGKPPGFWRPND